jgi:hypothetical protein
MNSILSRLSRDLTCAAASVAITLIAGMSFIDSTAQPPGAHAPRMVAGVQPHTWFGQPQPAVLVD